jgi:hypothetical protein
MKIVSIMLTVVVLVILAPIRSHAEGEMIGRDPTYRRGASRGLSHGGANDAGVPGANASCSSAVARCKKNFPTSAAACTSAGESCRQSGTFTNPKGQSFSGLKKN